MNFIFDAFRTFAFISSLNSFHLCFSLTCFSSLIFAKKRAYYRLPNFLVLSAQQRVAFANYGWNKELFLTFFFIAANLGGNCFWGKIPIESLCLSLEKSVTWNLNHKLEMISTIDMHSTILKVFCEFSGLLMDATYIQKLIMDFHCVS